MAATVEVGFPPEPLVGPWPQFLASSQEGHGVERIYELGPDGWRCVMIYREKCGYSYSADLPDPVVADALWSCAAALTADPEVLAVVAPVAEGVAI